MAKVVDAGVNSFKFFFAYKGAFMVTDETYLKGLMRCKELGALPMVRFDSMSDGGSYVFACLCLNSYPGHGTVVLSACLLTARGTTASQLQ